jgi:chromosome segregation ATPase
METTYEKVRALRKDKADSPADVSFKKAVVGGYECREVDDYIQSLRNNLQLSEKAFNEKLEEYVSTVDMYRKEREKFIQRIDESEREAERFKKMSHEASERAREAGESLAKENRGLQEQLGKLRKETENNAQTKQKIDDYEKEIERLKKINYEAMEQIRETDQSAMDENRELRELVDRLQREMDDSIQSQRTIDEMNTVMADNARLTEEVCSLSEKKDRLNLQNDILIGEVNKIEKANQRLCQENDELKKNVNALRLSNRNCIMETGIKIFEFRQNSELGIETISSSIGDITRALELMKADLCEFSKKFEE